MGTDYIGEVEIEEGKCIHSECIAAFQARALLTRQSVATRPMARPTRRSTPSIPVPEARAVFTKGERLGWFDY
jgi:hypothetical protein